VEEGQVIKAFLVSMVILFHCVNVGMGDNGVEELKVIVEGMMRLS